MTDFAKELEGKAYQLCNGLIELDDFRSWFTLAMAARTPSEAPTQAKPARKDSEFSDYYQAPYEPMDRDMEAHHRKLMGGGDQ
jgi:hypothetical protein